MESKHLVKLLDIKRRQSNLTTDLEILLDEVEESERKEREDNDKKES